MCNEQTGLNSFHESAFFRLEATNTSIIHRINTNTPYLYNHCPCNGHFHKHPSSSTSSTTATTSFPQFHLYNNHYNTLFCIITVFKTTTIKASPLRPLPPPPYLSSRHAPEHSGPWCVSTATPPNSSSRCLVVAIVVLLLLLCCCIVAVVVLLVLLLVVNIFHLDFCVTSQNSINLSTKLHLQALYLITLHH